MSANLASALIGSREALPRMAHLLLELYNRLKVIGHTRDGEFGLPISQADLSDCLGHSVVHTNRVLQTLRSDGLISLTRSQFEISRAGALEGLAGFDPTYLHLGLDI